MRTVQRWLIRLIVGPILLVVVHLVVFKHAPVPLTPLMIIRWTQDHGFEKKWVPLNEMSPHLARAIIASEDNRFCEHDGIDWSAVGDVVSEYRADGRLRGASTLSMQTVKNLYLWPSRSVIRKGLEVGLVHALEAAWSKERIIEVYLNIAEMGPGIYGVQAASQHHFRRDAADLTFVQSASLAAILPAPLKRDPTVRSKAMGRRVRHIRRSVANLGPLLECVPTAPAATAPTQKVRPPPAPVKPSPAPVDAPQSVSPEESPSKKPKAKESRRGSSFPRHIQAERKNRRADKNRKRKLK